MIIAYLYICKPKKHYIKHLIKIIIILIRSHNVNKDHHNIHNNRNIYKNHHNIHKNHHNYNNHHNDINFL